MFFNVVSNVPMLVGAWFLWWLLLGLILDLLRELQNTDKSKERDIWITFSWHYKISLSGKEPVLVALNTFSSKITFWQGNNWDEAKCLKESGHANQFI